MIAPAAGKLALVTGAAGDIGRAVAVRLATDGASVIAADLMSAADGLAETQRLCVNASSNGLAMTTTTFDVTDTAVVRETIAGLASELGPVDLLFNNAGYQGEFANTLDASIEDVRRVLEVNVTGVFAVLQAFAQQLQRAGRPGAAVNTASMPGVSGAPNKAGYSSSKAAGIALTKSAAKDLAPHGIRVNAISPAFVGPGAMWDNQVQKQAEVSSIYFADTETEVAKQMIEQIPMRRYGSLDEVASVAAFLLSDDASYLTGVNLEVSGGST
ncbi:MAG: SDR family oxidoreductase [Acidimicrobiales bacterium]|nr:MAG: SDR family oxidoreductase [Acidimicrobiales bacterium]